DSEDRFLKNGRSGAIAGDDDRPHHRRDQPADRRSLPTVDYVFHYRIQRLGQYHPRHVGPTCLTKPISSWGGGEKVSKKHRLFTGVNFLPSLRHFRLRRYRCFSVHPFSLASVSLVLFFSPFLPAAWNSFVGRWGSTGHLPSPFESLPGLFCLSTPD